MKYFFELYALVVSLNFYEKVATIE
jgi:hypothetical protein